MKIFEQIYSEMCDKKGRAFSHKELIQIFEKESSWIGDSQQLLELRSLQFEITGIRPGNCSSCNLDVLKNMARWLNQYELEHPAAEMEGRQVEELIKEVQKYKLPKNKR